MFYGMNGQFWRKLRWPLLILSGLAAMAAGLWLYQSVLAPARGKLAGAGFEIDYFEVRDAMTLATVEGRHRKGLRMLVAARLGRTRLIDNIEV
jgi:pantoate--beta-alanine ligase